MKPVLQPLRIATPVSNGMSARWVSCSEKKVTELLDKYGLAGTDFVNQLHRELYGADFLSEIQKLELTELMAEIDFRLVEGGGEAIQLDALTALMSKLLG